MKLRKVINRVHRGTTYYRWVVSIPPKEVRALGWVDGQKLEVEHQGSTLYLHPARPSRFPTARLGPSPLEEIAVARAGRITPALESGAPPGRPTARER